MKRSKKPVLIILCVIALAVVVGILCIGLHVAPTVNHALRIAELLKPVTDAKNQAMHIAVSAEFGGNDFSGESDVYLVTEDNASYLALEQNGNAVYVSDNILFLENGKAFRLGDTMQTQMQSMDALLPQIGALYEALKITAEETDGQHIYTVTVTGEQVKTLLEAASLGVALPVEGIHQLRLQLTERNGKLHNIIFSGSGNTDKAEVRLQVTLSGFRILAAGDYPIPGEVKQSAATVNRSELFSLTEDLYRLVLALTLFADMDKIGGTLNLAVDCGPLQLDTQMTLSDLKTASNSQLDPEKLQTLPEALGLMCMEGDISCTKDGGAYVYRLILDQPAMQALARMILPELAQYGESLTEGEVSIRLEHNAVTSMKVFIEGKVRALLAQIPVTIDVEFVLPGVTHAA